MRCHNSQVQWSHIYGVLVFPLNANMTIGLPTRLENEKIILENDFTLAKEGEELTVEKAKILKLMGYKLDEFKISIVAAWTKAGVYTKYE